MSPRLRGKKIVLGVADEPLRDALRRTLEREGAAVVTHPTAKDLIDAMGPLSPDACLVDVDLPDLSGEELIDQLRVAWPRMPILLVSAHLFAAEATGLRGLPTLPLPFRRKELLEILDKVISTASATS